MSTNEEIREVYEADIAEKSRIVFRKRGVLPFLITNSSIAGAGLDSFGLFDGLGLDQIVIDDKSLNGGRDDPRK